MHRDKGSFHRVLCDLGLVDIVLCVRSLEKHEKLIIFDYFLCLLLSSDVLIHFYNLQDHALVNDHYYFGRILDNRVCFYFKLKTENNVISF